MNERKPESSTQTPVSMQVCPWWCCFTFDNFLRRWLQNPTRVVRPYLKTGDKVLDVGPGMGYFSIPLAKLVGDSGRVIAADLQPQMLNAIQRRAIKAGVEKRIQLHRCRPDQIGVSEKVDFALAFWMVHEVPDKARFLAEIASIVKPGGLFLLCEPKVHVTGQAFAATLQTALKFGFKVVAKPPIFISQAVLLKKP
jgi:ubiquinone/menaquinone biosynthesis C-methylase UbiE